MAFHNIAVPCLPIDLDLNFSVLEDTDSWQNQLCGRLEIGPNRMELMISCTYRPPHTNVLQFINELSNHLSSCTGDKGSILGPTLFNLYVNDMPNIAKNSTVIQYADDSLLLIAHDSVREAEEMLQYDFNMILN
ncbi:hypothetical protein J437_LFUL011428 [Ladona fulva]|uniref:Reverse transcriptase domain-containing protein n=1 Tax=Ladona fulva TaxID=123851 RepID=A0A8K0PA78_LADFU|nr:hypothetical protein J437_LFUL011428 [Ladona fulva]